MWCSFYDNEPKRCNESLPIRNSIPTDDFFSRLQDIACERDTYLALVVIDLSNHSILTTEGYTFDGISLGLTAACTHCCCPSYSLPINFYLTLHDIASLIDWRLEIASDVLELNATQADRIVVFKEESDSLQLRYFLYVKSLKICLRWPFEADLFVWNIWNSPEWKFA